MNSLININPDFKLVIKALNRIAAALEMHLQLQWDYRAQPPSKDELAGEPPDVQYASNEDTLQREFDEARREIEQTDEAGLVK
jgi:hypothetical protein